MSVSGLGTLAAARDAGTPKKSQIGKAVEGTEDDGVASVRDLLVTAVPTEIVGLFTAAMAVLVGGVEAPTVAEPDPDDFAFYRWLLVVAVIVITALAVNQSTKRKQVARRPGSRAKRRVPVTEIATGCVAAAGWALSLPESPLTLLTENNTLQAFFPLLAAIVAVGVLYGLGQQLQKPAS
jgi:hypothetical protein